MKGDLTIYTCRPGIAAILHVSAPDHKDWTVIYLAADKPLHVESKHVPHTELPGEVLDACRKWFMYVFSIPLDRRGNYLDNYHKTGPQQFEVRHDE